jgi:hypothetical protein
MGEGKKERNVFIGRNPDTGRPYFERRKVMPPLDPEDPANVPTPEQLSPPGVSGPLIPPQQPLPGLKPEEEPGS